MQVKLKQNIVYKSLPRPDKTILKLVEEMKLRDGIITPDMCKHLTAVDIIKILLNQ